MGQRGLGQRGGVGAERRAMGARDERIEKIVPATIS